MRMNFYMVGVTIDEHKPEYPKEWMRAENSHAYLRRYYGGLEDKVRIPCDVIAMSYPIGGGKELDIQMAAIGPSGVKQNPDGGHLTLVWNEEKCWWETPNNTGWVLCWKEGYQHVPY